MICVGDVANQTFMCIDIMSHYGEQGGFSLMQETVDYQLEDIRK